MTREEAQLYTRNMLTGHHIEATSNHYIDVTTSVNKIYDDFESRTCENCKWDNSSENIRSCSLIGYTRYKDFGCNKFERKENE